VAYAGVRDSYFQSDAAAGGPINIFASDSTTRFGWTAGGGAELGFGQWSVKGEALYYDLGKHALAANCTVVSGAAFALAQPALNGGSSRPGVGPPGALRRFADGFLVFPSIATLRRFSRSSFWLRVQNSGHVPLHRKICAPTSAQTASSAQEDELLKKFFEGLIGRPECRWRTDRRRSPIFAVHVKWASR
jgi:hypothetical protein